MGGNALKTKRLLANDYKLLEKDIIERVSKLFPETKIAIPKYFSSKESFGDMDILFEKNIDLDEVMEKINLEFNPSKSFYSKEHLYSFENNDFQIDLIFIKPEDFEFAKEYYSYNDLGIFIGRIADSFGIKYGSSGVYYTLGKIQNNHTFFQNKNKIHITRDYDKALDLLGFDVERYHRGFNNMEEIYKFVTDSQYFTKASYKRESQNNANFHRNKTRKNFVEFQKLLNEGFEDKNIPFEHYRTIGMDLVHKKFPDFRAKYDDYVKECNTNMLFCERFNGKRIIKVANVTDMEISSVLEQFKQIPNLKEQVLSLQDNEIDDFIINHIRNFTIVPKTVKVKHSQKNKK